MLRKFGVLALLALAACQTAPERRWEEARFYPLKSHPTDAELTAAPYQPGVTVTSYATPPDVVAATAPASGKGASIKDLSDHGQGDLVKSLATLIAADAADCAADEKTPCKYQTLLKALGVSSAAGAGGDSGPPAIAYVDATALKRVVVVNVLNAADWRPGDRLAQYTVDATPVATQDGKIQFTNFTIAQTQSTNDKLGSVVQTTQFSLTGNVSPTLGVSAAAAGTAQVAAAYSNNKAVSSDITQAFIPLNVNLQGGDLFVQRRGDAITDISGNTLIALTVVLPKDSEETALVVTKETLFKAGAVLPAEKASLAVNFTDFASDKTDVMATVALDYQLRHILSGGSTYTEGDDSVSFVRANIQSPQVLIPQAEIIGEKWIVLATQTTGGRQTCELKVTPKLLFSPGDAFHLYFSNALDAGYFVGWLNAAKGTEINAGQLILKINGQPVNWKTSPQTFRVANRAIWRDAVGGCDQPN